MADLKSALADVPRRFVLGANVHENVRALRVAAGSVVAELSAARLAALIGAEHPSRKITATAVQRWEAGVEPDYESTRIMAGLAGVTFEEFAFGHPAAHRGAAQGRRGTPATKSPSAGRKPA